MDSPSLFESHINILLLPRSFPGQDAESETVLRLREFRLESLQLSPEALASSYESESQFTEDVWQQRLENPRARHLVAVRGNAGDLHTNTCLASKTWVGMIVVLHRSSTEDVEPARSPWEPAPSQTITPSSTSYHLNGFFVHPSRTAPGPCGLATHEACCRRGRLAICQGHCDCRFFESSGARGV